MAGEKVRLTHTGPQIDAGIDAALNPDTVPEADSDALITSDAVAKVQQGFAPIENAATAANAYAIGDLLVWEGVLYKAKAAIAVGDSFTVGTNIETTTVADKLNNIDSQITTNTDTTISGLLKGSSGKVAAAVGDADYATPAAVTATRQMLAPILSDPAGQAVSAGDYFIYNGTLYKALQAITSAMTAATFTGATYSEAVSGGGLNALKSALDGLQCGEQNTNAINTMSNETYTVFLPKAFSNTDYAITLTLGSSGAYWNYAVTTVLNKWVDCFSFVLHNNSGGTLPAGSVYWEVKPYTS